MPCAISAARGLACKDSIGGVKAIYLCTFDPTAYAQLTFASGVWTETSANFDPIVRYDVRPNSSGLITEVTNDVAGSAAYTAKLSVVLHKLTQTDNEQLQSVIQARFFCWVMDANDVVWSLGLKNGCTVSAATMSVGTARADLSGYTLEIEAGEATFPHEVVSSTDGTDAKYPFDAVAGTGTISVTNPS